jgi:hypothetical protein
MRVIRGIVLVLVATGSGFAQQRQPNQPAAAPTESAKNKGTEAWLDAGAKAAYIVGLLAVATSVLVAIMSHRDAKKAIESANQANQSARKANELAERAIGLNARVWADEYFNAVRLWADEASNNIALAIHLNDFPDEVPATRLFEVRAALSGLLDRGRWYFPNRMHTEIGQHKAPAFRGLRQPILDGLAQAYRALNDRKSLGTDDTRSALVRAQRLFVSEVQRVLDPRTHEEQIKVVREDFRVAELLRGPSSSTAVSTAVEGSVRTSGL